jgi:hypothetical protein
VFRYQPSPVEDDLPKPEDDSEEVADWFTTKTDPAIAQAVARAEAEARASVPPIGASSAPGPVDDGRTAIEPPLPPPPLMPNQPQGRHGSVQL